MDIEEIKNRLISLENRVFALEFRNGKFTEPTPQQVENYGKSIDFDIDGENFCDFYQSKNWMIGKSKMKDWQAAVRTWKKSAKPQKDKKLKHFKTHEERLKGTIFEGLE